MLRYFCTIVVFLIFAKPSNAQLNEPLVTGARGLAMGGTGLNVQDVQSAWGNPAGLSKLDQFGFSFYGEQRFTLSDIRQISATAAMPIGKNAAWGLVLGYYGFEAYNEQRIGLAYGRKLSDKISIGTQLYSWSNRIPEYGSKTAFSFELGAQGKISSKLALGVKVINPVRIAIVEEEYLPSILSLGLLYQPGKTVIITAEAEKDILHPMRIRFGVEYNLLEALDLRLGVVTNETQLSFGFGYNLMKHWQLNFAASYHQYLGFTPAMGVVYR